MQPHQPTSLTLTAFGKLGKFTITQADIAYLKGDGNYTLIYFASGRRVLSARTLFLFEDMPGFIRIHKSYLVNGAYINALHIINPKTAFLVLKSGTKLAVARRRITQVAEQLRRSRES